jgi:hypothetical protein
MGVEMALLSVGIARASHRSQLTLTTCESPAGPRNLSIPIADERRKRQRTIDNRAGAKAAE